ncbi:Cysteine proteinase inhibitor 4 [Hirschfeldia incana]|nr:Cysteine proteinase inhibitor 4 [Hirschfeldia incana]
MKSLICLSLILLPLISVVEGFHGKSVPIKDVSVPNVIEVAKYAIDEHNSESNDNLVFVKIVEGKRQVISAIIYDLIIAAMNDGGATKNYKAVVMESGRDKILYSFNEV